MTPTNYKPIKSIPCDKTCTQGMWNSGGSKSSSDNYRTYEISAFQHIYLYRHKPKWFGQYEGDRYLGKLRWVSRHADGKQHKFIGRHGMGNGIKCTGTDEKHADSIARALQFAYGYIRPWFSNESRTWDERLAYKARWSFQGMRCAVCGQTYAEVKRKRNDMYLSLRWGKLFAPMMESWDADQMSKQQVTCKCGGTK